MSVSTITMNAAAPEGTPPRRGAFTFLLSFIVLERV